jgi:CBS domain-containing protein
MITCPFCGSEILEGADICDDCQHSLTDMSIPQPTTPVEKGLMKDRIQTLEPKTPHTVSPETPVGEVLTSMMAESIGCVMIVQGDELLGIFSERDALMKLNAEVAQFAERPISAFMTTDPITLEARDRIAFALHKMHVGGYRHIPIMTKGKLTGVISIRDILGFLTEKMGVEA